MFIPDKKKFKKSVRISGISFEELLKIINDFLIQEKKDIILLNGFNELVHDYFNLDKDNLPKIHYIMIASNSWNSYFSECMQYLNYVIYTKELEKDYIKSFLEKRKKGDVKDDEYLKKEKHVAELTKSIINMKLFSKYLLYRKIFSCNISYHCKRLYGAGINNFLFKTPLDVDIDNI